MKFLKNFSKHLLAVGVIFATVITASLAGSMVWQSQAKAEDQVRLNVYFRVDDVNAEPVNTIEDVEAGQKIHVYLSVVNEKEGNTIEKLQYYAPFSHRGILNWVKADDQDKIQGADPMDIKLSNNQGLKYVKDSTKRADNRTGSFVVSDVSDKNSQSRLFSDSSNTDLGFFFEDIEGGKNEKDEKLTYIAKYELEVIDENKPVFNSNPGDADTFMVRRKGDNEWKTSLEGFKDGDKLEFRVYAHNNTRGSIALGTKVGVENWPGSDDKKEHSITGFVDADNAERVTSSVSLKDNDKFELKYVKGSTWYMGRPSLEEGYLDTKKGRPEGIINPGGVTIGEGDIGGVDGCFDFVVYAFFEAEVKEEDDDDDDDEACFEIRVWEDFNGNGRKDSGEPGLDWDSEWQYDGDSTWTAYKNYANRDGKGSKICTSKERKTRTRLVVKDWCKPTTVTNREDTLEHGETKLFEFGCRREKPTVQKGGTPTQLPKTGTTGEILLGSSVGLLAAGTGLTLLRRRMQN